MRYALSGLILVGYLALMLGVPWAQERRRAWERWEERMWLLPTAEEPPIFQR